MQTLLIDATSSTRLHFTAINYHPEIMLMRHVHCTTCIRSLYLPRNLSHGTLPCTAALNRSFYSLTRSCAKPRATKLAVTTWNQELQRRGAKRKVSLDLDDVLQGALESDALPPQDDAEPEYPPLLQQVRNNMLKFNHCVLVTRVGGFYEVCSYI